VSHLIESSWQQALKSCITDLDELLSACDLKGELAEKLLLNPDFPLRVPRTYVQKIEKGNIDDPLLKQILPLSLELSQTPAFNQDPLQETNKIPVPGLIHKYHGRVLVTLSGACAINCRYCFRRHFPYQENNPGKLGWQKIFDYLSAQPDIFEVILSGGDPMTLKDSLLSHFYENLGRIPHIQYVRIHSRLLSVIPTRVTPELTALLAAKRFRHTVVLHINHPREIDTAVIDSVARLRDVGVTVFNQSVLLKGVNDSVDTLISLQKTLYNAGIVPYYMHLLDKVAGSAHFDIELEDAKTLMIDLMSKLPGYLVPRWVRDVPNAAAKIPLPLLY
jgi:EF-P beta-lysylation protein EpmB